MSEIEKIADDRYRLRAHDHVITRRDRDLCDLYNWRRDGARMYNLEMEARAAVILQSMEKPWLPIQPGEEF